jgi:3-methyladenine DNA glycosylase AlkD
MVPDQRKVAQKYINLPLQDIEKLLKSPIHEYRLVALMLLVYKYKKSTEDEKKKIYEFYISHTKNINNWDLVDVTAPHIVGTYLLDKEKAILYKFAVSENIWERRIAIVATAWFIRNNAFDDTLNIAKILLHDKHDLIHKAVGWMLREVGKKDQKAEESFLLKHYKTMPRTMLRYAIEKFDVKKKEFYMKK